MYSQCNGGSMDFNEVVYIQKNITNIIKFKYLYYIFYLNGNMIILNYDNDKRTLSVDNQNIINK
jgi:hypothetical protein